MKNNALKKKILLLSLLETTLLFSGCEKEPDIEPLVNTAPLFDYSKTETEATTEVPKSKYNFKEIENIIDNNMNFSKKEKDFLKKLQFIFDENHMYMDIDMVKERLYTLKINYSEKKVSTVGGFYSSSKNEITIYNCKSIDNVNMNVFIHEFLHVLQSNSSYDFTTELSNEFFARETLRRLYDEKIVSDEAIMIMKDTNQDIKIYGHGYDDYMSLYYTLAELIDEETLREYQFTCNIDTLINGLSNCNGSTLPKDNGYDFINILNDSRIYNKETHMYDLVDKFETGNVVEKCYNCLDYYFAFKFGHNIKDDLKVSILYYNMGNEGFLAGYNYRPYNADEFEILNEYFVETAKKQGNEDARMFGFYRYVTPRTYLSNTHLNPEIIFNSPSFVRIEIDDNVSKEFSNKLSEKEKSLVLEL